MKNFKDFQEFLNEMTSGEIYHPKRNKPMIINPRENPELANEFFNLISIAYSSIGGHVYVKSPEDVFSDPAWNWWQGEDIHGSPDFDLIMFGQKTKYGVKFSGVGHDGSSEAKREYIKLRGEDLIKPGFFAELSGKIAEILLKSYHCPEVDNKSDVEKILGKTVIWTGKDTENEKSPGNSWYVRNLGGHPHSKIMLGKPKI